jgi:hypothetical protein
MPAFAGMTGFGVLDGAVEKLGSFRRFFYVSWKINNFQPVKYSEAWQNPWKTRQDMASCRQPTEPHEIREVSHGR